MPLDWRSSQMYCTSPMAQSKTANPTPANPFAVDHASELPVGVQIGWRLRALVAGGRLAPGDSLPSVRRLAEWADVNVNTVRAVYAQLERDGIVVTRHGLGTFVAEGAARGGDLERIALEAIEAARESGADPRDLAIVTTVCAGLVPADGETLPEAPEPEAPALPDPELESDERTVRNELRRQIGRLEAELASYVRDVPAGPASPAAPAEAHVAGVAELERTRDALLASLSEAHEQAERRTERERRARERRDEMLRDPAANKWEVVSAAEAGEEGCTDYRVSPRYGPLGVLMRWWQVKVSGGCPLAAPLEAATGH